MNINYKLSSRQLLLIGVLFSLLLTSCERKPDTDRLDIQLIEILTIGEDDPESPNEYLFEYISTIALDSRGYIYVGEHDKTTVRVYDPEGNYTYSIGGKGRGPGEFEEVTAIHIDRHDRLVVVDRTNARLTLFMLDGELIDIRTIPDLTFTRTILELDDDSFLFLYASGDPNYLVHAADSSLREIQSSFVSFDEVRHTDTIFEELFARFNPGLITPLTQSDILYVPYLYGGILHRYSKNDEGEWKHSGTVRGFAERDIPLREVDRGSGVRADGIIGTPEGMVAAIFYQRSQGLFTLSDGSVVHFTAVRNNEENIFRVELFDRNLTFIGFSDIEDSGGERIRVLWKDDDDNFYIADGRDYPKLVKSRLELGDS